MRNDIQKQKNNILQWIKQNRSKAYICKQLKCKPETLNGWLKRMDIEYSGNKGLKARPQDKNISNRIPALDYLKTENPMQVQFLLVPLIPII